MAAQPFADHLEPLVLCLVLFRRARREIAMFELQLEDRHLGGGMRRRLLRIAKVAKKRKVIGFAIEKSWVKVITAPKYSTACRLRPVGGAWKRTPIMKGMVPKTLAVFIGLFLAERQRFGRFGAEPRPEQPQPAKPEKPVTEIRIGYLRAYAPQLALSVLDIPPRDEGVAGANVAVGDNNTTGSFLGQKFTLDVAEVKPDADVVPAFQEMVAKRRPLRACRHLGQAIAVDRRYRSRQRRADLQRRRHRRVLREEECRVNVFHMAPTRAMLADGLAQYLIWKQWPNWVLIYGSHEGDQLFADALRRAATRFGGQIVAEKEFKEPARRGGRIPASSRSSGRCRSSRRICPTTMSCWSPTRARCSAPTCRSAPGFRGRSPARRG